MTSPNRDTRLIDIADYVCDAAIDSDAAFDTAHYCLLDALACGFQALDDPACTRLLGPVVPGATLPGGARVPGTSYELDPVTAAFNIGAMTRWLDRNATWLAAGRGHPSDNLGGILAVADYLSRQSRVTGEDPLTMSDVLSATIKAYEIQGCLAPDTLAGRDDTAPVRAASTAVVARMLGGDRGTVLNALSQAWADGDAPHAASRERWAAGDATSRGVRIALMAGCLGAADREDAVTAEPRTDDLHGRMAARFPVMIREGRAGGLPSLARTFVDSVSPRLGAGQREALGALCADRDKLAATAVDDFMALLVA